MGMGKCNFALLLTTFWDTAKQYQCGVLPEAFWKQSPMVSLRSWKVTKVISMCTICLIQCQCEKSKLYWWYVLWTRKYNKFLLQRKDWFNSMKTLCLSELGHCNPWLFKSSQTPPRFRRALNVHRSVYPSPESTHISFPRKLLFL